MSKRHNAKSGCVSRRRPNRKAIVRRDQVIKIERPRRPGTGRPPIFALDTSQMDAATEEALRPPPVIVNGRRIDV
jgi:hypothetical protein